MIWGAIAGALAGLLILVAAWRWLRRPRQDLLLILLPQRTAYELHHGATIGRDPRCDITVTYDEEISARHAVFLLKQGSWYIKDLNSKNGVYVNGQKVTNAQAVVAGDLLTLGGTRLEVVSKP